MIVKNNPQNNEVNSNEISENKRDPQVIHLNYERAILSRRISSSILDFFVFAILFVIFFVSTRAIIQNDSRYKEVQNASDEIKLNCGLYYKNDKNEIKNLYEFYEVSSSTPESSKRIFYRNGIENFIVYNEENSDTHVIDIQKEWDDFRLGLVVNGKKFFEKVYDENDKSVYTIEEVKGISIAEFNKYAYGSFITSNCCGAYIYQNFSKCLDATRLSSNMLLGVEIPISLVFSSVLTFLVPPLIFKRGRQTLGKLLMRCGLVDKNYYHVGTKLFLLRFAIIFILEIALSFVTFGIPLLISALFLTFTKKHQPLHDFILKIDCVETSYDKIYYSKTELVDDMTKEHEHIDFRLL